MEAKVFMIACPTIPSPASVLTRTQLAPNPNPRAFRTKFQHRSVTRRNKNMEEQDLYGLPKEYYDDKIEEAAEKGELTELVLKVIWNRLDLARRDEERDAVRSLDLLYRRVETEILKREATPAMTLLNDLLNLHDGFDDDGWMKQCRKRMLDTFPQEDPFSILVPVGFDIDRHHGQLRLPPEPDNVLLRVDFVREVDALLQEVRSEPSLEQTTQGLDPDSVAGRLKQQERQRTIRQVEALLDLAVTLKW
ncbi:protein PALE CRESS, chloroplastic isoform X3 [Macadamia integrifolia]|uniref:protein PALE CRESS, chloroplastic isoform X3 n=1 Tax=Macadamia integrifolia TaxID=60698 RepID=UPI001C4E5F0C|nr:protein PALE CRESS, chloroplastic isoform X3 [Macadamia integrifolia]